MRRKPLSMKALTQYLSDFMFFDFETSGKTDEELNKRLDIIKEFIDYIWKNPK